MKNILTIALLMIVLVCLAANVQAAPSDANPGSGNQYGWEGGANGIAVPELDPGLLICALTLLVGCTFIMTAHWRKKNSSQ